MTTAESIHNNLKKNVWTIVHKFGFEWCLLAESNASQDEVLGFLGRQGNWQLRVIPCGLSTVSKKFYSTRLIFSHLDQTNNTKRSGAGIS